MTVVEGIGEERSFGAICSHHSNVRRRICLLFGETQLIDRVVKLQSTLGDLQAVSSSIR